MDMNTTQRKYLILFVVGIFMGWLAHGMIGFYTLDLEKEREATIKSIIEYYENKRNTEECSTITYIIHEDENLTFLNGCYNGCYNAITLILEGEETVESRFPESYKHCKEKCDKQHGR